MKQEKLMPAHCYLCSRPLTTETAAREHIIPSALGGKLRSKRLVCRNCNSTSGHEVDADLARYLAPLSNLVSPHRDRGEHPPVIVERASGEKLRRHAHGRLEPATATSRVVTNGGATTYQVTAPNRRAARRELERLRRSYPSIDIEAALASATPSETYFDEKLTWNLSVSSADAPRAVAKIAVGYFLHVGGERAAVGDAIAFIRGARPEFVTNGGWHAGPAALQDLAPGIHHAIVVIGDPARRTLHAYVELFSAIRFAWVLSRAYDGPALWRAYAYDLDARRELPLRVDQIANPEWWVAEHPDLAAVRAGLVEIMRRADDRSVRQQIHMIVQGAFADLGRASPSATSTADLWPFLWQRFEPFIQSRMSRQARLVARADARAAGFEIDDLG